jgi:uncharacterized protein (DUF433 family)
MFKTVDLGTKIVKTPETCGGRPRITGTRVAVQRIIGWYKMGFNAEEIAQRMGNLDLGQIYAALAYYHINKEEIETYITQEKAEYERLSNVNYSENNRG